jgi:sarcosine oxidase/L-pipecolate oxidase
MSKPIYDVIVIGGGAVGLATAYEVAKAGSTVILLEQNTFFNQAGSSGDLNRMFRTMWACYAGLKHISSLEPFRYTEDYLADLAKDALDIWDELESDAGVSLRWMGGLLNFGDPNWGSGSPEGIWLWQFLSRQLLNKASGTLLGPIPNLKRLDLSFKKCTRNNDLLPHTRAYHGSAGNADQIEKRYPFKNLPKDWEGLYAPDNGVINVQLLLRTLYGLAKDYGAEASQYRKVQSVEYKADSKAWEVAANDNKGTSHTYQAHKIVITSGAYTNHVLQPNFGLSLDLDIVSESIP